MYFSLSTFELVERKYRIYLASPILSAGSVDTESVTSFLLTVTVRSFICVVDVSASDGVSGMLVEEPVFVCSRSNFLNVPNPDFS